MDSERNQSYEPPFAGARPQLEHEFREIHGRWVERLKTKPPEGVPADRPGGDWPATFGPLAEDGETPIHQPGGGGEDARCLQCGGCQDYIPLEGQLGYDWGACSNRRSEYDGRAVFEHWTCTHFRA